jgi:hypothetical protein
MENEGERSSFLRLSRPLGHGWPLPRWQIEVLEQLLQPAAFLSGISLFLIPYESNTG